MGVTQVLNSKAVIKKLTTEDLPFSTGQSVISSYYAQSTVGQTVINLGFSVQATGASANTDAFWLFVDGKKLDLGSSNDYVFTAIGSDGTSSQVTLNAPLPAIYNIQAFKLGLKPEVEFQTDNRFVQLYNYENAGFQGFIDSTTYTLTPTTTTGSPAAGTFYSSITGRASLVDLSQNLKAVMGINRISTQQIYQLQNESGPNQEPVFAVLNDTFGQIRLVGTNWVNTNSNQGAFPTNQSTVNGAEYAEITFYGTGLNMLTLSNSTAGNYTASVDGGAQGSNLWLSLTTSNVLQLRNYAQNQVLPVVSGLALGIHTVRIFNQNTTNLNINLHGFEILNDSSLRVNSGIGYIQNKQYIASSQNISSYSSAVTGTRGGRVVAYLNGDGSVGKAWTPVNTSSALLTAADHTNEEVSRVYTPREFGQGRTDDFSRFVTTATTAAFTLDDDTTSLQTTSGVFQLLNGVEGLAFGSTGQQMMFTFVGTGLDVQMSATTLSGVTVTYQIDGSSAAAFAITSNVIQNVKVVSGLPYGTHTFKLNLTASTSGQFNVNRFVVYHPKKPTVPSGSIEIADYNVLGNFVANTSAVAETISTGVIRKAAMREMIYTGTSWTIALATGAGTTGAVAGIRTLGAAATQQVRYTFFGTGLDLRMSTPVATNTFTMSIDGTNPTAAGATSTGFYGNFSSFVASTGVATSNGTGSFGNGLWVSGLPLGYHTVVFTQNAATSYGFESMDIITPVYVSKSNLYANFENELLVGSNSISDSRSFTAVKDALPATKVWSMASGVFSTPTTASTTLVPVPDMSCTVRSGLDGKPSVLRITYSVEVFHSVNQGQMNTQIFLDGVAVGTIKQSNAPGVNGGVVNSDIYLAPVAPGAHKIDVYWSTGTGATMSSAGTERTLVVEEK